MDRTLWDFDRNSSLTIAQIIDAFNLEERIADKGKFIDDYNRFNDVVWDLYRAQKLTKSSLRVERFKLLFESYGLNDEKLILGAHEFYLEHSPRKPALIDGAKALLDYLAPNYTLHIVSNGFYEVQVQKLEASGIKDFFYKVFTSDRIEISKPDRKFFEWAVRSANAKKVESIVIGDDISNDVVGAFRFGLDQIWFNPAQENAPFIPTYEVTSLKQIMDIL